MARIKGAMMTRKRRNKILKMAKGYWGSKSKHFRVANQAVMKSLSYAYTGRRLKKRDFRSLWITRISAACAQIFKGENELASMVGLENGTICISATETALHCCLFQAVEQFTKEYPEVRFKLLNNSTAASIQALKTGKADLAVVSSDPAAAPPLRVKTLREPESAGGGAP